MAKKDAAPAWATWTIIVSSWVALGGALIWALWFREPAE